jgi:tetratricopeptide (TPR) repeat protein
MSMPSARFRLVTALVVLGGLTPPARLAAQPPAGLDPEPTAPYQWRVVVQAKPHPLLSPAFRDQLRRDLLAALQPALGPLGTVEVLDLDDLPADRRDPLVQDFVSKGFAALDAPRDLSGLKTHFLRVEVKDGAYHLEARQHDGFTGLASPLVRRQAVPAPELVGRAAGLMIDRDFGLAGTVEPVAGKDEAVVRFRGGKLGPLDRLVKVGDVLAVSRITRSGRTAAPVARTATGRVIAPAPGAVAPPALTPTPLPYTLLRVAEVLPDGAARCQVLTGYKAAFPPARDAAGFRALKLGTVRGPVAVRLASADGTRAAAAGATVRATDAGFDGPGEARDFLDVNPQDGVYRSGRELNGVACVTVALGATRSARFPVPVLGPDPVPLPFEVDAAAEDRAVFERAVLAVASRAADARKAQFDCFTEVAELIKKGNNRAALDRAAAGAEAAKAAAEVLGEEVAGLKAQEAKGPAGAAQMLANVERQLAALRAANAQLEEGVRGLRRAEGKADAATGAAALAEDKNKLIALYLSQGRVDEALDVYAQLVTLLPNDPEIKARRDRLAAEWAPKGEDHKQAREYLLTAWPKLATLADLRDALPQLRQAVDALKKAGDKYAFRQLGETLAGFPARLDELTKDLDATADRTSAEAAKVVRAEVEKVAQEVDEFLKANP